MRGVISEVSCQKSHVRDFVAEMSYQRSLESGIWGLESGIWSLESGPWGRERGIWSLEVSPQKVFKIVVFYCIFEDLGM